jgi:OmpA-OmpF porin, OOP family
MKKTLLLCLSFAAFTTTFAQSQKKAPSLGINFFLKDFLTADRIKKTSVSNVLANKQIAKVSEMTPGLSLTYLNGITDHIDFMATLGGTFTSYKHKGRDLTSNQSFLLDLDAQINVKLLTDNYTLVPYLTGGVGASMYAGTYFMASIPVGAGLQVNLGDNNFLFTQVVYKSGVTDKAKENFNYSLGFTSPLSDPKPAPVKVAPPPPPVVVAPPAPVDTDKDGITDDKDKCPSVAGVAKYNGCPVPDTDKDGINDENDKCPKVAGLAKYAGCPIPDTDKDGINDEQDKCPTVAGVARYQGCPIPDTDGDGVNDEEDKCKDVVGVASNNGCPDLAPVLNRIAKSIYYTSGTSKFASPKVASSKLDSVVLFLKQYPSLTLDIEGHTDNTGKAATNKALSQKRAEAIVKAIVAKGIAADRLKATGFGSEKPVGDNKTKAGKALNRRTEIIGKFYTN